MKTNKNTLKYLCFVFAFAILHYYMQPLNIVLGFVFPVICLFYSAECTGFSKMNKSTRGIAVALVGGLVCAALTPGLEKLITAMMNGCFTFHVQPFAMMPSFIISIALALALCKLRGAGLKLPTGSYTLLCLVPPVLYLMLGLLLTLVDVEALELSAIPGMYSGSVGLNYNNAFFAPMRDICSGWSIFVMMKYNQSMKIKKLFEMMQ